MEKEITERAYRLYVKMRCETGFSEAWIDEDTQAVADYLGMDKEAVTEDLESLTNCGLLEHDPGYGYLIGGERHAI